MARNSDAWEIQPLKTRNRFALGKLCSKNIQLRAVDM